MDFSKIIKFCAIAIATLEAVQSVARSLVEHAEREKLKNPQPTEDVTK
jgi:hypothetical protein